MSKVRKNTLISRNSTNVYDLRGSSNTRGFSVSFFFCMCKSNKVTPVSYLLKFYTLEILNTVFCLILAITYFVLHRLSVLKVHNETAIQRQIVLVIFATSLLFISSKLCMVISNRSAIQNTIYTSNLTKKDTFCKVVTYLILSLLAYFTYSTAMEGWTTFEQRKVKVSDADKKAAKLIGLMLMASSGGLFLQILATIS